jgi:hypothetical protein
MPFSPEYHAFSKRFQQNIKHNRVTHDFESVRRYALAEKWFEERRTVEQVTLEDESKCKLVISKPSFELKPPPGLFSFKPVTSKCCTQCLKPHNDTIVARCCSTTFCNTCYNFQSEMYNRCWMCKKVVDMSKYNEYEGLDLCIPTYEDFDYDSSNQPLKSILKLVPNEKNKQPKPFLNISKLTMKSFKPSYGFM